MPLGSLSDSAEHIEGMSTAQNSASCRLRSFMVRMLLFVNV